MKKLGSSVTAKLDRSLCDSLVNGNKKACPYRINPQISAEGRFILLELFIVYILGEKQKIRKI